MVNKIKKEIEEMNRRIYGNKSLAELKIIGKKKGLLNVDQYKKANKNALVERLVKGRQLSDERKEVLLGIAQNEDLKVNASMSKEDILKKNIKSKTHRLKRKTFKKISRRRRNPFKVSNDKQRNNSKTRKPNQLLYCRIIKTFGS